MRDSRTHVWVIWGLIGLFGVVEAAAWTIAGGIPRRPGVLVCHEGPGLTDHTKINRDFFESFGSTSDVDLLISDVGLDAVTAGEFEAAGLATVLV